MASRYDDELWELVPDADEPPPDRVAAFVRSMGPVERALDLGCGDGRLSRELRAEELTLADVSPVALERAGRRLPGAARAELEPDAALPFTDSSFDLALVAETIEHVRDVQLLVSELRRVLVPGGALALTTPAHGRRTGLGVAATGFERHFDPLSPHLRFFTRRSVRAVLDGGGFDVLSVRRHRATLFVLATR
jgi:SAM-dependent methyltransferase